MTTGPDNGQSRDNVGHILGALGRNDKTELGTIISSWRPPQRTIQATQAPTIDVEKRRGPIVTRRQFVLLSVILSAITATSVELYKTATEAGLAPRVAQLIYPGSPDNISLLDIASAADATTSPLALPSALQESTASIMTGPTVLVAQAGYQEDLHKANPDMVVTEDRTIPAEQLIVQMQKIMEGMSETQRTMRNQVQALIDKRTELFKQNRQEAIREIALELRRIHGDAVIPIQVAYQRGLVTDNDRLSKGVPLAHFYIPDWVLAIENREIQAEVCVGSLLEAYEQHAPEFQTWVQAFLLMSGEPNADLLIGELEARHVRTIPLGCTQYAFEQLAKQFNETGSVNIFGFDLPDENPAQEQPFNRPWSTTDANGNVKKIPVSVSSYPTSLFNGIQGFDINRDGRPDINYNLDEEGLLFAYVRETKTEQGIERKLVMGVARIPCGFNLTVSEVITTIQNTPTSSPSSTQTGTPTSTGSPTSTGTRRIETSTSTSTPTGTATGTPTSTKTPSRETPETPETPETSTPTSTPTGTPTSTNTPQPPKTGSPTPTIPELTSTNTPQPPKTGTPIPTVPESTSTNTPQPPKTGTPIPTNTSAPPATATPQPPTAIPTPENTSTPAPTSPPPPEPTDTPAPPENTPTRGNPFPRGTPNNQTSNLLDNTLSFARRWNTRKSAAANTAKIATELAENRISDPRVRALMKVVRWAIS